MARSRRSSSRRSRRGGDGSEPTSSVRPLALVGATLDAIVVGFFLLILLASPLPMGSNRDWAWAPLTVMIGIVAALVGLGFGSRRSAGIAPRERLPLALLIVCFLLMVGIGLLQMSTLVPPTPSAPYYARAAAILGRAHAAVPTLSIDATLGTLLRCVACGLVFMVARIFCTDERRARLLLYTLIASAILVMIYAVLGLQTHSCFVGNYLKKQGEYVFTDRCIMSGTFVNSNSFGCFLGMAVAAALGMVFAERSSRRRGEENEEDQNRFVSAITLPRLILVAIALFLTGGLLLSASRSGFAAFAVSMLMMTLLLMRGRWRSRRQMIAVLAGGLVAAVAMLVLAGGVFLQKMANFAQANSFERPIIWKAALQAIEQSPWWGWGLGSFGDIYTILQPTQIAMANDKAHSTPLETFVELGIPGGVIACLVVLIPWIAIARGAAGRRRRHRYLPAAAFAASSVAILHSLADFSLQMPAIGFFVSALLGMGWAQSFTASEHSPRRFTEPVE